MLAYLHTDSTLKLDAPRPSVPLSGSTSRVCRLVFPSTYVSVGGRCQRTDSSFLGSLTWGKPAPYEDSAKTPRKEKQNWDL